MDTVLPECPVIKTQPSASFEKVTMILSWTSASIASAAVLLAGVAMARADDYGVGRIVGAADRCSAFGPALIDLGRGTCGRVHVRVDGMRNAMSDNWTRAGSTSSAALRSDGAITGTTTTRLRVRGSLDPYNPFH